MTLTKRADPDGTFSVLDGNTPVAIGLPEAVADAQVADSEGKTGPGGQAASKTAAKNSGKDSGKDSDPGGAKDGGRASSK
jgi:hypothetical protein